MFKALLQRLCVGDFIKFDKAYSVYRVDPLMNGMTVHQESLYDKNMFTEGGLFIAIDKIDDAQYIVLFINGELYSTYDVLSQDIKFEVLKSIGKDTECSVK